MINKPKISTKAIGEAGENIVIGKLMLLGLDIYRPSADDKQIDAIVRVEKKSSTEYYELQIKSVKAYNDIPNIHKLHEKPDNYILILHFRHDQKEDEFFYLKIDQALELWSGAESKYKEIRFKVEHREAYKNQTLENLTDILLNK